MHPLDCKETQPVHCKGDQSWVFIERNWWWSWNSSTLATWLEELTPWKRLMLKLKLQYFGHLMRRVDSLEKTLILGKIESRRRRGWQRMKWMASRTRWTWVWVGSRSWWAAGRPGELQSMGSQRVRHNRVTGLYWTEEAMETPNVIAKTVRSAGGPIVIDSSKGSLWRTELLTFGVF